MDDNYSICGICGRLLQKIEVNKNRPFNVPDTNDVIKISDALYYIAPEAKLSILEQMELCINCLEKLRLAYKFKYDCLHAESTISKYLQENQLSLEDTEKKELLKENNDVTLPPEPPEDVSGSSPSESDKNADTARKTPDISVKNDNQPIILEKTSSKAAEAPDQNKTVQEVKSADTEGEQTDNSLLHVPSVYPSKSGQICEPEVVSNEENVIPDEANFVQPPQLTLCETAGLLKDKKGSRIPGEYGKSFKTKAVQSKENVIAKPTNFGEPPDLTFCESTDLFMKQTQNLGAIRATVENRNELDRHEYAFKHLFKKRQPEQNVTLKQGNVIDPPKLSFFKVTALYKEKQDQHLRANKSNSPVFTINNSNNADETRKILQTKAAESEETVIPKQDNAINPSELSLCETTSLSKDSQCRYSNIEKDIIQEATVNKSNTADGNGKAAQTEIVTIKQENVTEPNELTFCETTGLFKNNQNQYFSAEGKVIEPDELEEEAQKALEKVNSIFTEPIINNEPIGPVVNSEPVLPEVPSLVPLQPMGLTANAGILTPVTVTEDNGVLSITPVGDAVKNSFITLENPFIMEDMIDIKEEPLDKYDFDSCGTDEDTISAPETMLQDSQFGRTDEYIDIPDFVMVNKKGEHAEQNLEKMQPAVLGRKLFGSDQGLMRTVGTTAYGANPGWSGLVGVPVLSPGLTPIQNSSPVVSSTGKPRRRTYKRLKMVPAYETIAPETRVEKDYSLYAIRKQHPSLYSSEYLASFFAKNGDYVYDHDYIVNMYHHSVAIVLNSVAGKKLWFCRLCNNQQWTLNHGEHMLEAHALTTRCTVCDVDMHSPFALNLHVEQHTEACQYCAESVTYGARHAHALKHQEEEQMFERRPRVYRGGKRRRSSRQHTDTDDVPEPPSSPDIPPSNSAQDEVPDTSQGQAADTPQGQAADTPQGQAERSFSEAELENLLYKTDESQDTPDDVRGDTSYSPTPRKRKLRRKRRRKSEVPPVEPSGRLLRSHIKKSQ